MYTDFFSDTTRWLKLFFGLPLLPSNEVHDAFVVDIMPNTLTSDVAAKFADYVLENYIDVDSKYPPTLWAQPQDGCEAIRHTISGVGMSHLNAEFYAKHPIHVCRCTEDIAYSQGRLSLSAVATNAPWTFFFWGGGVLLKV